MQTFEIMQSSQTAHLEFMKGFDIFSHKNRKFNAFDGKT